MRIIMSALLSLTIFMSLMIVPAQAQDGKQSNADQLKRKMERLENINLKSKSLTVEDMYRKMLLETYADYRLALEQELADLRHLVSIAGENQRVGSEEAISLIRKLTDERDVTIEKINTLRGEGEAKTGLTTFGENNVPQAVRVSNPTANTSSVAPSTVRTSSANIVTTPNLAVSPTTADPPANNAGANVDWETRTAGCPAKVTASTSATIHVTNINDLMVDFDSGAKLEYQLRAKGTPVSAVPPENPFFTQSGRATLITSVDDLLARLAQIRTDVMSNPALSRREPGGPSIPLRTSYNAAKSINNVQNILVQYSQNQSDPIFTDPRVAGNPVFQWIKLIEGSHSYDFTVVLEPGQNYEFTLTEKWKGQETQGGTKRWDCGERDIFSLSIGPIISTLPMRKYNHQKALVPPGTSNTQDILVVENSRNINVLGAALLNYHFPHINRLPRSMGFTLSAGPVYTLGGTPEVSPLGLFVGPSFHLNRSLFITPGLHIGQFADFPAGFAPGTVIPNQFGELNPVKRMTAHFAFGITYRTNSFKKSSTASGTANNAASTGGSNNQQTSGNQGTPGNPGTGPKKP